MIFTGAVTVQMYCFAGLDSNERWFGYSETKGVLCSTTYVVNDSSYNIKF